MDNPIVNNGDPAVDAYRRIAELEQALAAEQARVAQIVEILRNSVFDGHHHCITNKDMSKLDCALDTAPKVLAVVDAETFERNDLPPNVDSSGLWITCQVPGKYPQAVTVTVTAKGESDAPPADESKGEKE